MIFTFALFSIFFSTPVYALDGREIMLKHEDARRVDSFVAKAKLSSLKADGSKKEKTFTIWRKLKSDGIHFSSLTRFHTPAEVKGEGILFLENNQGENDIMLYLPAYQKVRRIERAQQSSSFMGSDFSYSDITTPHVDEYVHALKGEEPCPVEALILSERAKPPVCFKIEAKPVSDAIRERTGYSKTISWVRKENFMVVKNQNFDSNDSLVKVSILTQIEKLASGKWFTHVIAVSTKKDSGTTTLSFSEVKTDEKISDAFFTQASLAKGGR